MPFAPVLQALEAELVFASRASNMQAASVFLNALSAVGTEPEYSDAYLMVSDIRN